MTTKATIVRNEAIRRLKTVFETQEIPGVVKSGWAAQHRRDNANWPLVCIAPAISQPTYHSSNITLEDATSYHIQLIDIEGETPVAIEELTERLELYLKLMRQALFKPVTETGEPDRFAKWGSLLTSTPTEGREARFIDPEPGEPYAGISFVLTTTFSDNL